MAVVEISCPRCGSVSHLKNEKTNEYRCDNCSTTFVLVDTMKKEVVRDTKRHNCPTCGRPVSRTEAYVCTECGTEDLCKNCLVEINNKIVCMECAKKEGKACYICGKKAWWHCGVCGHTACRNHADRFNLKGNYLCPNCGAVCKNCYVEKVDFLGKTFYCKKCGTKLTRGKL